MTESHQPIDSGEPAPNVVSAQRTPSRGVVALQVLAILGAVATGGVAHGLAGWYLPYLAILAILAVSSELTATALPSGHLNVSGSFLGIMLAAVLLGGPAAAVVGMATVAIGWFRWRESSASFRHNLLTFAWFPLLSGLWFYWISGLAGVRIPVRVGVENYHHNPHVAFYLLVFATFLVGLCLNWVMNAAYTCWRQRVPILRKLAEFKPVSRPSCRPRS
jgi:hypothetical protein